MIFVPEKELYCFMLRGYHLFSERISPQWIQQINAVIDEMKTMGGRLDGGAGAYCHDLRVAPQKRLLR